MTIYIIGMTLVALLGGWAELEVHKLILFTLFWPIVAVAGIGRTVLSFSTQIRHRRSRR